MGVEGGQHGNPISFQAGYICCRFHRDVDFIPQLSVRLVACVAIDTLTYGVTAAHVSGLARVLVACFPTCSEN